MKLLKKIFKKIIILVILFIGMLYNKGVDAQAMKYTINFVGNFENSKLNKNHNATGSISIDFHLPFNQLSVYNVGGIIYDYSINLTNINSSDYSHSVLKGPTIEIYENDYIGQFSVPLGIKKNTTTENSFYGTGTTSMLDNNFEDYNTAEVAYVINNLLNETKSYEYKIFNVILYLKSENITPMAIAALKFNNLTITNDTNSSENKTNSTSSDSNTPTVSTAPTVSPTSSLNPGGLEGSSDSSKSIIVDKYPTITFITIVIISAILLL